ncbi:hypothetical protein F4808DRAFT_38516 [Astrocystis sublimbata]|nr:hypothetical protein F4808DRAFT_38516 [Astrocystis sublimbata]
MALRAITLLGNPGARLPQFISYAYASRVQTALQQELLAWKARPPASRGPPPPPSVICFTPAPTYTFGRRQTEPLSAAEEARLRAPLSLPTAKRPNHETNGRVYTETNARFLPAVTRAPRGGLTTYHGPGQLVIWPVIDLHSPLHPHLSVRDYACLLEKSTIAVLKKSWWGTQIDPFTTENPGVWVKSNRARCESGNMAAPTDDRKIAALGVHLRRHVTGLGVAINFSMPVVGSSDLNPWDRIVACGLGDRRVTSISAEANRVSDMYDLDEDEELLGDLAERWQTEFERRLMMHNPADSDLKAVLEDEANNRVTASPYG